MHVRPNPLTHAPRLYSDNERDAMSRRGVVVVLILIGSVLLGPIAMAYAGCSLMGAMCDGPCGMSCAVLSPTVALAPVSSAALHIVLDVHRHRAQGRFVPFAPGNRLQPCRRSRNWISRMRSASSGANPSSCNSSFLIA